MSPIEGDVLNGQVIDLDINDISLYFRVRW